MDEDREEYTCVPVPRMEYGIRYIIQFMGHVSRRFGSPPSPAQSISPHSNQPERHPADVGVGLCSEKVAGMCVLVGSSIAMAVRKHSRVKRKAQKAKRIDSEFVPECQALELQDLMKGNVLRDLVGACIYTGIGMPAWHVLPVFLNLKMAADPALPGLSDANLPMATTAIFVGWMLSATFLERALEIFDKKQLMVLHMIGLLLLNLAILTLPHLTAGNFVVFTAVRFVQGLLMNITGLLRIYVVDQMPPGRGNQVLVLLGIIYSLVTMFMSWSCGGLTLMMDWRLEAFLWCTMPMVIGLVVAFPNWWAIVQSLPVAISKKLQEKALRVASQGNSAEMAETLTVGDRKHIVALAVGFLACDCGFYGLTYSAGQLSKDIHLSIMLLSSADVFGFLLALGADKYGRNNVQACAFLFAGLCLSYCSTAEPGSSLVLSFAVLGRVCLDVCSTTIYVALAEVFTGSRSRFALGICETMARFGGTFAPLSGTLPPSISCPIFATVCFAAAASTMTLPEKPFAKSSEVTNLSSDRSNIVLETQAVAEEVEFVLF